MKTYEYDRVRVPVKMGFLNNRVEEDYFDIIQRQAAEGWRLAHIFSPNMSTDGARWVDLIFERER